MKNETLYTNRFGLNIKAKVMKDVTFNTRLLMYKEFGSQANDASRGNFFSDRVGVFDGTQGHVPSDGQVSVDQAYMTINNIAGQPIWFSIGRRPSTGGIPTHLRQNDEKPGVGGVDGLLVDYAYDGLTLGYAPDIDALPGAYAKFCYGRGYQRGFHFDSSGEAKNMDLMGLIVVPYDTDPLTVYLQANHAFNVIDFPVIQNSTLGSLRPSTNLGDIDQFGVVVMSTLKKVGPGTLNVFASGALDKTHPNDNHPTFGGMPLSNIGLMYTGDQGVDDRQRVLRGCALRPSLEDQDRLRVQPRFEELDRFHPGGRRHLDEQVGNPRRRLRGVPDPGTPQAPDRLLPCEDVRSRRLPVLRFQVHRSNNWVGGPVAISDVASNPQMLTPMKNAKDLYATLEVKF